jgi:hypothetical protein
VVGNLSIHDLAMGSREIARLDLVLLYEARVTSHVGSEDGCQPPLDLMLLPIHGTLSAVAERIVLLAECGVQTTLQRGRQASR